MRLNTERYYPNGKENCEEVTDARIPGAVVYKYNDEKTFYAYGWKSEKQIKADFYHSFRSEQQREEYIKNWLNVLVADNERKRDRKAERVQAKAAGHSYKVGDIYVNSWGYDCTIYDFYQVVAVKNHEIEIRGLNKESEPTNEYGTKVSPIANSFKGEILTKRVQYSKNGPRVSMEFGSLHLWDGKPRTQTER